jgi:predicted nucleic acid-binding protein
VNRFVVDASVAVKWVVEESGTAHALELRRNARFLAPDLLVAECANILWKKVERDELSKREASLAARLLSATDIELVSTRSLLERAVQIAIELKHPAYDCLYLAVAERSGCRFVTADERFLRLIRRGNRDQLQHFVLSLSAATGIPRGS